MAMLTLTASSARKKETSPCPSTRSQRLEKGGLGQASRLQCPKYADLNKKRDEESRQALDASKEGWLSRFLGQNLY